MHMRLMLVASISILPPAVARMLFFFLAPSGSPRPGLGEPPAVMFSLVPHLAADLLLVVAIVHDWRARGRPHQTTVAWHIGLVGDYELDATCDCARRPSIGAAGVWAVNAPYFRDQPR